MANIKNNHRVLKIISKIVSVQWLLGAHSISPDVVLWEHFAILSKYYNTDLEEFRYEVMNASVANSFSYKVLIQNLNKM